MWWNFGERRTDGCDDFFAAVLWRLWLHLLSFGLLSLSIKMPIIRARQTLSTTTESFKNTSAGAPRKPIRAKAFAESLRVFS